MHSLFLKVTFLLIVFAQPAVMSDSVGTAAINASGENSPPPVVSAPSANAPPPPASALTADATPPHSGLTVARPRTGASNTTDGSTAPVASDKIDGPLVSLLGNALGGLKVMTKKKQQRVYVSTVESKTKLNEKTSVTSTSIALKMEKIHNDNDRLAGDHRDKGGACITQEFILDKNLVDAADKRIDTRRGNTAVSANFARNDHSRIISRLTACIGRYTQTGVLTWAQITAGRSTIFNRDKVDGRIESGSDLIYIPRVSAESGESYAWYACIGAALGCGNRVIVDATAVDINNRVLINAPNGAMLVMGCIEALTRITNYYTASKAGVLASFAMAKGAHAEMSVVSHSDEGGYIRKMFRRNRYGMSYGVIWLSVDRTGSIPVPTIVNRESAARFFDSVALYSAASSAICDPLVKCGDDYYPSIYTAGTTDSSAAVPPTPTPKQLDDWAVEHAKNVYDSCGAYCVNMARMLDCMIQAASSQVYLDTVNGFLVANFASLTSQVDRHLRNKVVAPFCWIEPQNLVGTEAKDFAAQKHGFGTFVPRDVASLEINGFEEGSEQLGTGSSYIGQFYVAFTAARKNPMIMHLLNSPADGLACLIPRQTREDGLTLIGHRVNTNGFTDRALNNDDLESYLWRHASTKTILPAEMVQLQKGLGLLVLQAIVNEDLTTHRVFSGNISDLNNKVTLKPTQFQGIGLRERDSPFLRAIVRANSTSAAALDTNRSLVGAIGDAFTEMPVSATGTAPGVNITRQTMQDPRRLIITGDDPSDAWSKISGKVQTTVVSHKLRHRAKNLAREKEVLLKATGPIIEGGDGLVQPGLPERHLSSTAKEVFDILSGKTDEDFLEELDDPVIMPPSDLDTSDYPYAVEQKEGVDDEGNEVTKQVPVFSMVHARHTVRMLKYLPRGIALAIIRSLFTSIGGLNEEQFRRLPLAMQHNTEMSNEESSLVVLLAGTIDIFENLPETYTETDLFEITQTLSERAEQLLIDIEDAEEEDEVLDPGAENSDDGSEGDGDD